MKPSPELGSTMGRIAHPRQGPASRREIGRNQSPDAFDEHDNFEINRLWIWPPEQC
jgi:hypothetical protein